MKQFVFVIVAWVIIIGIGEVSAQAFINRYGNALDMTRRVLVMDPYIGWKQKANLATTFAGTPLHTDARGWRVVPHQEPHGRSVLFLGPSSTFGWGVADEHSYPALLSTYTNDFYAINAGEIGYSSAQGLILASSQDVANIDASVVVIAYGINDLDRHRFYYESTDDDAREFAKEHSAFAARMTNVIFSSSLVQGTFKLIGQAIVGSLSYDEKESVRVSPDDFRANMTRIVETMQERGSRVVLVTTAAHFPAATEERVARESERIQRGVIAYNDIVRGVASSTGSNLLDLDVVFDGRDLDLVFVDPVHFSETGNEMIAQALADILTSYDQ